MLISIKIGLQALVWVKAPLFLYKWKGSTALRPPLPTMVHLTTGHHDIDSGVVDLLDDLAT